MHDGRIDGEDFRMEIIMNRGLFGFSESCGWVALVCDIICRT